MLQAKNVCYGSKGNMFGSFRISQNGFLFGLKLKHSSGRVTCDYRRSSYWSYWGCYGIGHYSNNNLNTIITDDTNLRIYPSNPNWVYKPTNWYRLPGYKGRTNMLVFGGSCSPMFARKGQELRVWYGEDLGNGSEGDNSGNHCVDVYAMFR